MKDFRTDKFSKIICCEVLEEVLDERTRQEMKWGQQNYPGPEYLMILGEEVGEANKEYLETFFALQKEKSSEGPQPVLDYGSYRKELVQVAAVAVAMIESLDRNGK